jgi:dTDP-4-amino-4,6-dideoxygalactose transaminase
MNRIPINDPVRVYRQLQPEIDAAVARALASGRWIDGPFTARFAARFADWCGVARCVPLSSGTDALELGLRALGVAPGDEVITVANAGAFATGACRIVGAVPVWIDVRPETLGLDPALIAAAVTRRTKVVVATHLYGILADIAEIRSALDRIGRRDVRILEDCAQAHGAMHEGRRAGSLGDIAVFSFYPTKNLAALGNAGAVVTGDPALAERVARLAFYGYADRFRKDLAFGRNCRMDEIQAAVLCVKLDHVEAWNAERRRIIARYRDAVRDPVRIVGSESAANACHLAVARVPDREVAMRLMSEAGIATDIHYPILDCDQPSEAGQPGRKLALRVSEQARDEILTVPCYPGLTDAEIERVASALTRLSCAARSSA